MNKNNAFNFAGHSFKGVRQFTENEDFYEISKQQFSQVTNLSRHWSWQDFYAMSENNSNENYDIFLMDDKYEVLPTHNGLYIWGEQNDANYKKEQMFVNEFKDLAGAINDIKVRYIALLKRIFKAYNLSDYKVSTLDKLVYATFRNDGIRSEVVRSIWFEGDILKFETYNGVYYGSQLVGGLEDIVNKMKGQLF